MSDGALVVGFDTGSPAEGAGMTAPAVISAIDGQPVPSIDELGPLLHSHVPGETASRSSGWTRAAPTRRSVTLIAGPAV